MRSRGGNAEAMKRRLFALLEELRQGTVVVEGSHDIAVLGSLGIHAFSYERISKGAVTPDPEAKVYLLTDLDRRGKEKAELLANRLMDMNGGYKINRNAAISLLGMCNATCVEQITGPIQEIMGKSDFDGKNISGDSKIPG